MLSVDAKFDARVGNYCFHWLGILHCGWENRTLSISLMLLNMLEKE